MKTFPIYLCSTVFLFLTLSCSPEKDVGPVLCQINNYRLLKEEFQTQLAAELELKDDFKLTQKAKREFLEQLIKKELLIQEAKKRRLDQKEKFIQAIERYWEATLIRDLMVSQSQAVSQRIYVTEEDIKAHYKTMKPSDTTFSHLDEMRNEIRAAIREDKKTRMLEEWINALKKNADVEINEDLL